MIWRTTGSVLVVFLWSLTVVLGQKDWSVTYSTESISAWKGSTVELSCSYTYPTGTVISTFWYRKYDRHNNPLNLIEDPDYKDRVTYHISDTNNHKVIIKDLRKSDSTRYWFRFETDESMSWTGEPGVTLTVKDDWDVTYSSQSVCALKGSSVDLSCSYMYPSGSVTKIFWFTKEPHMNAVNLKEDSDYTDRVEYQDVKYSHTLTITDLRETDSAQYTFRFITTEDKYIGRPGVSLSVTGLQVIMTADSVTEGGSVTLTCSTTCTLIGHTYIWYRNKQLLPNQEVSLHLNPVRSEDAGQYSCAVDGLETLGSPVETLMVRYDPKFTIVSVSPSGEIVEGSSVTLTCSSDANPPVYNYTWYKTNVTSPKASGQSYSITNITSEDSGEYYCEVQNKYGRLNSTSLIITVTG
ncbi:hypothetical protein DPEC_G00171010 [Dallia pectoralis]|uniref:Uncharacterized protein n=1 Tax=Dallia pectoralis TaxID=75939 RepID=A0ACC2GDA2_DALPE|nr:hypothetical protein DPEC_G00171010 [Dallia pectoralis]